MSTLDEMEMPTLTFDPAPEPEEKAPVVPVQEEKAKRSNIVTDNDGTHRSSKKYSSKKKN